MTEGVEEVLEAVRAEAAAMEEADLDRFMAAVTDDAILLPPGLLPKTGAELRSWIGDFLRGFRVEWLSLVDDETIVADGLAYHVYSYTWRVSPRDGGPPTVASGKGLHVLERGDGGRWLISREIWNANPAG